jgi:thioredoxin 1
MTREINQENFDDIVSAKGIVLIDCWAAWCRNCDEFAEEFRQAASKNTEQTFATLDTQEQKELRTRLGIHHIPSLIVYRDGILLFQQPGSFKREALADIVAQAESLDMDQVRAELNSSQATPAA